MPNDYAKHEEEKEILKTENNEPQPTLFDDYNGGKPNTEWQDMPEFKQNKLEEYQKIIVRFDNEEDVNKFAKIIEQNITPSTKSIWFPKLKDETFVDKIYISEDQV